MMLIAISLHGKEIIEGGRGEASRKFLEPRHYSLRKTPFSYKKGTTKRTLLFFCLKGQGSKPQRAPLLARLKKHVYKEQEAGIRPKLRNIAG